MRTPKNTPVKPKILPVGSRAAPKGNSTPKQKKPRSTARYVALKIRLPIEDYNRGQPYFGDQKCLGRYVIEAYREKLNRAEANKVGRFRILASNMALLEPILKEMFAQGKLDFLRGGIDG